MASRNGLNPQIKAPKGASYGRALPSAFGFGNGIQPPGNGYLNILGLAGKPIPPQWTIEFWIKPDVQMSKFEGWMQYNDNYPSGNGEGNGAEIRLQGQPVGDNWFQLSGDTKGIQFGISTNQNLVNTVRNHLVFTIDTYSSIVSCIVNGNVSQKALSEINLITNPYRGIFQFFYLFTLTTQGLYATKLTDEFRMYSEILSDEDVISNYNGGIGNNPIRTENLFVWYQFERFEMLDFSLLQDGSNIKLGIKDMSTSNNHALPVNIDTDSTSPNYVITSF